jgi:hypothetical protein
VALIRAAASTQPFDVGFVTDETYLSHICTACYGVIR